MWRIDRLVSKAGRQPLPPRTPFPCDAIQNAILGVGSVYMFRMSWGCSNIDHAFSRERTLVPARAIPDGQSIFLTLPNMAQKCFDYPIYVNPRVLNSLSTPLACSIQLQSSFRNLRIRVPLYRIVLIFSQFTHLNFPVSFHIGCIPTREEGWKIYDKKNAKLNESILRIFQAAELPIHKLTKPEESTLPRKQQHQLHP